MNDVVAMVLWACLSKRGKFCHLVYRVRVSRVSTLSKVRVGIRVSVSLVFTQCELTHVHIRYMLSPANLSIVYLPVCRL